MAEVGWNGQYNSMRVSILSTSHKPGKQRKLLYDMPLHMTKLLLRAPLAKSLIEKHGVKKTCIRTGDEVTIIKGDFKGVKGAVTKVDRKNGRLFVEGATREKADGTVVRFPLSPSHVVITKLTTQDKRRLPEATK